MKRAFILFLALCLLAVPLAGCQDGGSSTPNPNAVKTPDPVEQVELRFLWWGTQVRHDRTIAVCDLFMEQYPNVKITAEFSDWDSYWDKLAAQAAGNAMPDVIQMSTAYTAQYYEGNRTVNLQPYVENGTLNLSDVPDSTLVQGRFGPNKDLYYVNLGMNALMTMYDPAVAEAAGITIPERFTWDDLYEWNRTVYNLDFNGKSGRFGAGPSQFGYLLRSQGYDLFNAEGDLGFDDPNLLAYFYDLSLQGINEGFRPTPQKASERTGTEDSFFSTDDQWIIVGSWSNIATAQLNACGRPLAYAQYPLVAGKEDLKPLYYQASQLINVTTSSKNPEWAVKLIDFITNSIEANEILLAERGVPINTKVNEAIQPLLDEGPRMAAEYLASIVDYVSDPPFSPTYSNDVSALIDGNNSYHEQVQYGAITPDEAARAFVEEAKSVIASKKP